MSREDQKLKDFLKKYEHAPSKPTGEWQRITSKIQSRKKRSWLFPWPHFAGAVSIVMIVGMASWIYETYRRQKIIEPQVAQFLVGSSLVPETDDVYSDLVFPLE